MGGKGALDPAEQALWEKVVSTVKPLHNTGAAAQKKLVAPSAKLESKIAAPPATRAQKQPAPAVRRHSTLTLSALQQNKTASANTLDSHWDRRFKKGVVQPDVSIDLHGTGLTGAYQRLDAALEQAVHHNLRVILLVTGKQRAHDRASGEGRGAIASVVRDWLGASRHAAHIAAVRNAHPRHGGAGALYIILKR